MTKARLRTVQQLAEFAQIYRGKTKAINPIPPPRIDWTQVMVDLHNAGCCSHRASKLIGASHAAALNWVKGGEPGHGYGEALLRLHASFCGAGLTTRRQHEAEITTSSSARALTA